jgi:hypothetical protein
MHRRAKREMLAVKQEKMVVSAPPDGCTFCGNEGAAGVSVNDGQIRLHLHFERSAHIHVCRECLETGDIFDLIKRVLERRDARAAAKSEEPRCVLCKGEDATGYRIDEKGIDTAWAGIEADCFLCEECIERDNFEDQIRAYLERRGTYVGWLHDKPLHDKPKEKLDCQLPIRMSKATREKLEAAAKAHGVTLNKLVNGLIEGGLKILPRKRPADDFDIKTPLSPHRVEDAIPGPS